MKGVLSVMRQVWIRWTASLLVAAMLVTWIPWSWEEASAATGEVIPTSYLTVNGASVDWVLDGTKPSTFGDSDDSGAFDYWDSAPMEFALSHQVTGLSPGVYSLSIKTFGSSGDPQDGSVVYVTSGGQTYSTPITYAGSSWESPSTLTVGDIVVGDDGVATLGFTIIAAANHYGYMGDVTFSAASAAPAGPKLKVSPSSIQLRPGATLQLKHEVSDGTVTEAVYYHSSQPSVVSVSDEGLVTAEADGEATITVTAATYDGGVIADDTVILVSASWQQLGEETIYVQPVPELQDGQRDDFIIGADISTILEMQRAGRTYYDLDGVERPLMEILSDHGVNWVRFRLWNDPRDEDGHWYGGGNTNKEAVIEMAKQAKAAGLQVLVDFHYSDFWADPGRQHTPKAWAELTEDELKQAVYDYTYEVIYALAEEGAYPDMVQIGNEINDGMLWPTGRTPVGAKPYIEQGIAAVRAAEADLDGNRIKIMIHRANPNHGLERLTGFYGTYDDLDYDVIGLSFYPFWHGTFDNIKLVMNDLSQTYDKEVVIAETSYGYTHEDVPNNGNTGQVFNASLENISGYKASVAGQASMLRDVIAAVAEVPGGRGLGMFYWEPAWLPGVDTGWATKEAADYQGEVINQDGGSGWSNQALFNFFGEALPSIQVFELVRAEDEAFTPPSIIEIPDVEISTSEGVEVALPSEVKVLYEDGAYRDAIVRAWTPSAYDYHTTGTYEAQAVLDSGETVTATITVRPRNYIANPGIESDEMGDWTLVNSSRSQEAPYSGSYAIHFWNRDLVTAKQSVTGLPTGVYTLSMRSRIGANAEPIGESYLYADTGEDRWTVELTVSGWDAWNLNQVEGIEVRGGQLEIGAVVNQSLDAGGDFDDWELIRTADLPGEGTPQEPEEPGESEEPADNSDNDGNNGNDGLAETAPESPAPLIVKEMKADQEGRMSVLMPGDVEQVLLPADPEAWQGVEQLTFTQDQVRVDIPSELLGELQAMASDMGEGAQVSFGLNALSAEDTDQLLSETSVQHGTMVRAAGAVYDFTLSLIDEDGELHALSNFDHPVTLRLKVSEGVDESLLGVYYIDNEGRLEYVRGVLVDGTFTVNVYHFSHYAVLEYDKRFSDVPETHWAYEAIRSMAAQHIVMGVSQHSFAPERSIKRAEFAAMVTRALNLQAKHAPGFGDVDPAAWYAEAIAAAHEAGIIIGRSADQFDPNAMLTRQEMAVMVLRAYEVMGGSRAASGASQPAADQALVSVWAQEAVVTATALGLVQGRNDGTFDPFATATRAETVQMIAGLVN